MKRLLPPIAVCLLLAMTAFIAAETLISPDMVKRRVVAAVESWTGWTVTVSGEATVAFFPVPSFTLAGVTIRRADAPALAEMPVVRGKFKLLPLLIGRIEARELRILDPTFHVAIDRDGHSNWEMGKGLVTLATGPGATGEARTAADRVTPGGMTVEGGTLSFANAATGTELVLADLDASLSWRSFREPASVVASFTWKDERVETKATLEEPLAFFSGGASTFRFGVGSPLVHVVFGGRAWRSDGLQLDGHLAMTTPALRRLIDWGGYPLAPGATFGPASIKGKAHLSGPRLAFADAAVELDGNQATGSLEIVAGADRPAFNGTLTFDEVDLTPYAEAFTARLHSGGSWENAPAEVKPLSAIDLDLRVSTRRLVVGTNHLGSASVAVVLARGQLAVNLGDVNLYSGRMQGTLTAFCSADRLTAEAHLTFDSVPLRPLLSDFSLVKSVEGTATGSLTLSGQAKDWGGLVRSGTGSGTLTVLNASLPGLDLGRLSSSALAGNTGSDGAINFSSIRADFTVGQGGVRTASLVAAGKTYAINLDGSASLLTPVIAAKGTLTVPHAGRFDAPQPLEVPFLVSGTWYKPNLSPDFSRLVRRATGEAMPAGVPSRILE